MISEIAKRGICVILAAAACSTFATDVVHIEGKWSYERPMANGPRLDTIERPFDAYIGENGYYFSIETDGGTGKRTLIGTFDGTDYFWVKYFSAVEDVSRSNPSFTNWMGEAEVGFGSFPSNAWTEVQALWLAFVWKPQPGEYPLGTAGFILQPMQERYGGHYDDFSVALNRGSNTDDTGFQAVKFYAPGFYFSKKDGVRKEYALPAPYDKGWLFCELDVSETAKVAGRSIPTRFTFSEYAPNSHSAANRDDVALAFRRNFEVTKSSVVGAIPSLYPPVYEGKLVGVKDYRSGLEVDYHVGGEKDDPGNMMFVSRTSPQYGRLGAWQRKVEFKGASPRPDSRVRLAFLLVFLALSVTGFFLVYRMTRPNKKTGAKTS